MKRDDDGTGQGQGALVLRELEPGELEALPLLEGELVELEETQPVGAELAARRDTELGGVLVHWTGERAALRTIDFLTVSVRNVHTRRAYLRAVQRFAAWCAVAVALARAECPRRRLHRGARPHARAALREAASRRAQALV